MALHRRFATALVITATLFGVPRAALAQLGDVKLMAPAAPGGGWDQTARSMQQALVSAGAAKSVQVTNVAGAGGTIGLAQFVNGAKGDANAMMVGGFVMMGAILTNKSPVGFDQVTPIARLTGEYEAIVVPAASPIKSAKDLVTALKADPGKVTWAGGSAGGVDHITAGLIAKAAGVDPTRVNYIPFSGGGEALAAVLSGQVSAGISGFGEFEGQIKAGKLRLIAITAAERLPNIDGPTLKEQGVDVVIANWRAVFGPPGLGPDQAKAQSAAIETMVKSQAWQDILKQKGWDNVYLPADQFAAFLKTENAVVADILKSIGLVK